MAQLILTDFNYKLKAFINNTKTWISIHAVQDMKILPNQLLFLCGFIDNGKNDNPNRSNTISSELVLMNIFDMY